MNARFKERAVEHPDGREQTVRFGGFEFDRERREVRKEGARIRLGGQPLQVLGILIENREQVVTREELHRRLWGSETFVDFEQGLNTAIARLRQALGDSADRPRFIETVPGEGYRFVGPVEDARPEPGMRGTRLPLVDRRTLLAGSLGLTLGMGGAYLAMLGRETLPVRRARRFLESGGSAPPVLPSATGVDLAISPDGRRVVYRVGIDGSGALYFRDLDGTAGRVLPGRDVATPFFSPDGRSVGFHRFGDEALMRVSPDGSEPVRIAGSIPTVAGASWSTDGAIVFGTLDPREGLKQVSTVSGAVRTLTEPEPGTNHVLPDVLPDGRTVLFTIQPLDSGPPTLAVLDAGTGNYRALVPGSQPRFASGRVLYLLQNDLVAAPFDSEIR